MPDYQYEYEYEHNLDRTLKEFASALHELQPEQFEIPGEEEFFGATKATNPTRNVQTPVFGATKAAPRPADSIISGFPEYSARLTREQRKELDRIAEQIVASQAGPAPIVSIVITGHADKDLRPNNPKRRPHETPEQFEKRISDSRARMALVQLKSRIRQLSEIRKASGAFNPTRLGAKTVAMGATKLLVKKPRDESEMRMNRRIEIFLTPGRSPSHPQPPPPPPPSDITPPAVNTKFKLKMLGNWNISAGVAADFSVFQIWDEKAGITSIYTYWAGGVAGGVISGQWFSGTLPGPWNDFTTDKPLAVNQFGGAARFTTAGGGSWTKNYINFMSLPSGASTVPNPLPIDTGFTIGISAGTSVGYLRLEKLGGASGAWPFSGP